MNTNFSARFCRKCLISSISVDDILRFAGMTISDYNIYARSGLPRSYPISGQDAAHQVVNDMIQDGYYVDFVELLIKINNI